MASELGEELMSIGEFARLARRHPKALRGYEREGLLRPIEVDALTGYRRYNSSQLAIGRLIAMLRGTDMSLTDISLVLNDLGVDTAQATERLGAHLESLEQRHTSRRSLVRHVHALLRKEPNRCTPSRPDMCRVMSIQRRFLAPETDPFIEGFTAIDAEVESLLKGMPSGPVDVCRVVQELVIPAQRRPGALSCWVPKFSVSWNRTGEVGIVESW